MWNCPAPKHRIIAAPPPTCSKRTAPAAVLQGHNIYRYNKQALQSPVIRLVSAPRAQPAQIPIPVTALITPQGFSPQAISRPAERHYSGNETTGDSDRNRHKNACAPGSGTAALYFDSNNCRIFYYFPCVIYSGIIPCDLLPYRQGHSGIIVVCLSDIIHIRTARTNE